MDSTSPAQPAPRLAALSAVSATPRIARPPLGADSQARDFARLLQGAQHGAAARHAATEPADPTPDSERCTTRAPADEPGTEDTAPPASATAAARSTPDDSTAEDRSAAEAAAAASAVPGTPPAGPSAGPSAPATEARQGLDRQEDAAGATPLDALNPRTAAAQDRERLRQAGGAEGGRATVGSAASPLHAGATADGAAAAGTPTAGTSAANAMAAPSPPPNPAAPPLTSTLGWARQAGRQGDAQRPAATRSGQESNAGRLNRATALADDGSPRRNADPAPSGDGTTTSLGDAGLGRLLEGSASGQGAGAPRGENASALPQGLPGPWAEGTPAAGFSAMETAPALPAAPSGQEATAQAQLDMAPQDPDFPRALGAQLHAWKEQGISHATLSVTPEHLGPIEIHIALDAQQSAQIELRADVASTREALQQALPGLRDLLGEQGVSVAGGGVSDQGTRQDLAAQAESRRQAAQTAAQARGQGTTLPGEATDAATTMRTARVRAPQGALDLYA
ncbi:flagellar hook-length control protein FliK [Ideonella livida]|uniref:Flagellar hook-length control protein-like C-terminal domain-containing protein n=1 Tax=Ideonella livida TaxID=2707176 RepID=A0A7C9TNA2_9BURK|nr:flagellar hook-length control protein FliK [Ideonella livida]NDY92326.1 hypothetical protein [Ideonella livida]